jgi:hypothetical protein
LAGRKLSVAIPDTVLEDHDSLREKTVKLGQIARSCSLFGVDLIQVFRDPRGRGESALMRRVLDYLETPQYLRKRLFPLDESLRFAGLLPPLRIPSHRPRVPVESLRAGELREGFVLDDGRMVDIGLDRPLELERDANPLTRITVRVTGVTPLRGTVGDRSRSGEYWGYSTEEVGIGKLLSDQRFPLKIATSRSGRPLPDCLPVLGDAFSRSRSCLVLFGSPSRGLRETIPDLEEKTDFVVNLYPEQHVATVRTEEAVASALYLLELLGLPKPKV